MDGFSAIIVDDEKGPRENLALLIGGYCPEINVISTASSAIEAKDLIKKFNPDVVFLDINMPVTDGFEFLESLPERNFMLVFVSAYEEFGIKAVKAKAIDYLLKPVNINELQQTVKRLVETKCEKENSNRSHNKARLVIPQANGFMVLETDNIIRLEGENCYTKIYKSNGKVITVSRTLKEFEDSLPEKEFFRIHKSHIINLKYFKEFTNIDGGYAVLTSGLKLEVSRRRHKDFVLKAKQFLSQ
jgi:two-component system LytT family response regulator